MRLSSVGRWRTTSNSQMFIQIRFSSVKMIRRAEGGNRRWLEIVGEMFLVYPDGSDRGTGLGRRKVGMLHGF